MNFIDPPGLNLAIDGRSNCQWAWRAWSVGGNFGDSSIEAFADLLPGCVVNNGSGGREPVEPHRGRPCTQGLTPTPGPDDCQTLANTADQLAKDSWTDSGFVSDLAKVFSAPDRQANGPIYSGYRSSGFQSDFTDEKPASPGGTDNSFNQVNHYSAVFALAYVGAINVRVAGAASGGTLGGPGGIIAGQAVTYPYTRDAALTVANLREGGRNPTTPSHFADRRLNAVAVSHATKLAFGLASRHDLGNMIRSEVCDKR